MTRNTGSHGASGSLPPADAAAAQATEKELPLVITHADMDAAFERGDAVPVTQSIGWLMRHRDAWWVIYEEGWLRVIEGPIATSIDQLYPRLAAAETAVQDTQPRYRREED